MTQKNGCGGIITAAVFVFFGRRLPDRESRADCAENKAGTISYVII
ncbi:MAG: hypothetical protein J6L24_03705 [Oscillospiraceae bacterium]|nr:hypothetical protein [Oscillospiraceae bacterium]